MGDTYTVTTRKSWFSRLGSSVAGVLVGLLLLLACIVGLFWNEGRAVTTARSLAEGAGLVVTIPADEVSAINDGRLVHVTGNVTTNQQPSDTLLGVSAPGLRLIRRSEMYQWRERAESESRTTLGGGEETVTTYSYAREWASSPQASGNFKQPDGHRNPDMTIRGDSFEVSSATMGAFTLDSSVIGRIGGDEKLIIGADYLERIRTALSTPRPVSLFDGGVYIGRDPVSPQVGDYRIFFDIVPAGETSIVGRQSGSGFAPYQTQAGDRLLMVETGSHTAEQMFADAVTGNTVLTWILRVVGLILLAVAFGLLLAPLGVVGDVIPFIGRLVRMGTGVVSLVLAILTGAIVIAVAWFWYRPLLSIIVLAVGFGLVWLVTRYGGRRQPVQPAAPA